MAQPVWYRMIEEILNTEKVLSEEHLNYVKLLRHLATDMEWEPSFKQRELLDEIWDKTFEE